MHPLCKPPGRASTLSDRNRVGACVWPTWKRISISKYLVVRGRGGGVADVEKAHVGDDRALGAGGQALEREGRPGAGARRPRRRVVHHLDATVGGGMGGDRGLLGGAPRGTGGEGSYHWPKARRRSRR
jgi:hypothetical protein